MKSFYRAEIVFALFVALAFTQNLIAQDQPVTTYTYLTVNYPGASDTLAYAINNKNEVVGYYTGDGCSQTSCGFTYLNGTFTSVECALENATDFFDISNTAEIVGTYAFFGGVHGFIWQGNSSCFDIVDPLGGAFTEAWGVNTSGTVVGFYSDAVGNFQGFEYVNQTYTTLACSGWTNTRAYGISDAGIITGDNANSTSGPFTGFASKGGKCLNIIYPNAVSTSAKSANKKGQVSGWYTDSSGVTHGFVKTGSTYQSLDYPGAIGTLAYHMNDKGLVAGFYTDRANVTHGFVAVPK
jgi:hypothetical protein